MFKNFIFFICISYVFSNFFISSCNGSLYAKNNEYINYNSEHNTNDVGIFNDKKVNVDKGEVLQKNNYSLNVFNYDKLGSRKSWASYFLKNEFWNSYYSLSSASTNPWHLIAFPLNFVITNVSRIFFGDNVNKLFFQKLNLLVPDQNQSSEFYSYLEDNINRDVKIYEKNIYLNQDIAKGIGVNNLINFRNEFQKQIATEVSGEEFLTDRINDFIDNYKVKKGFNLEQYYKNTFKYRILTKLGLKDMTFEEQRTREFLFTYLKTSIMFSLDAKYSYEYTIFRNNFFYVSNDTEKDFISAFSNFKYIFEKIEKYKDANFYDIMDYFAWKIALDDESHASVPSFSGDYAINYADKIIPGTLPETNKIFSNSSEYQKMDFCLKCGALSQKIVRWGISGAAFVVSYKVILSSLLKSGWFWTGSSLLLGSISAPIAAGLILEYKKTQDFSKFMKKNFAKDIRNDNGHETSLAEDNTMQNYTVVNALENISSDMLNNNVDKINSNVDKTNAKLFNIAKYQEKLILESSDKNSAVKVSLLENIMNSYKDYIILNKNSTKTMNELTDDFKKKLRENDFAMIREKSANESEFSDKFTKIFSKIFNAVKNFFIGDGNSSYINYKEKYDYISSLIDSVASYTMAESYHNAMLNMYDDFTNLKRGETFTNFFDSNWKSYLNQDILKNSSEYNLYVVEKEFKNYVMTHVILDGLYVNQKGNK